MKDCPVSWHLDRGLLVHRTDDFLWSLRRRSRSPLSSRRSFIFRKLYPIDKWVRALTSPQFSCLSPHYCNLSRDASHTQQPSNSRFCPYWLGHFRQKMEFLIRPNNRVFVPSMDEIGVPYVIICQCYVERVLFRDFMLLSDEGINGLNLTPMLLFFGYTFLK